MDLEQSFLTASSGINAQSKRMRVIAENIANAETTATDVNGNPYRRKTVEFRTLIDPKTRAPIVEVSKISEDNSPFLTRYDPTHPAANAQGFVNYPNVHMSLEMSDMREAQSAYESNLAAAESARNTLLKTLELLR